MKIGYIGLGALGGMLARQFLKQDLTVWDLNPEAVKRLAAEGQPPPQPQRTLVGIAT